MRSWWLVVALLLSVGLNLGFLAQKAQHKRRAAQAAALATQAPPVPTTAEKPGPALEADVPLTEEPASSPEPLSEKPAADPEKTSRAGENRKGDRENRQESSDERPRRPGLRPAQVARFVERIAEEVGVAGEQRARFVALQQQFFDRTVELRQQHRRQQMMFRENMLSVRADQQLARRQLADMAASQQALEQAFVDNFFATCELLDPEQTRRYRRVVVRLRQLRWERGADGNELDRVRHRRSGDFTPGQDRPPRRRPPTP